MVTTTREHDLTGVETISTPVPHPGREHMVGPEREGARLAPLPNGAAAAAILAAVFGCLAFGVIRFALVAQPGLRPYVNFVPAVPGASGQTTYMVAIWLLTWGALHRLLRGRQVAFGRYFAVSAALLALATFIQFPPIYTWLTRR